MGSIGEEEKLIQMVRDYYESSESINNISHPPPKLPSSPSLHQSMLKDILLEATDFETEMLGKIMVYIRNMGEPNTLKKWVVKRLQMDGYKASLCKLTYWITTFGRAKGDYEYIEVMNKSTRLIVEMELKSQFELARPTQSYKELMKSVPSVFVGSEERLNNIISVLCSAAKHSLKEKGLHIPPWRKTKFMQSKWVSKNCKKISIFELQNSPESTTNSSCCPSIF
ncbi:hypothetical protein M5689_024157 [Euphorbia peplus]|nr:hypothetical protein M5689_024157 [Euphorbia peplus]